MTQMQSERVVEVKAAPNVYTVLMIVAILALVASVGIVGNRLMAKGEDGYGMTAAQLFEPFADVQKAAK